MIPHAARISLTMIAALSLVLSACGGSASPEERICEAVDDAAFDLCADAGAGDLTAITNALNVCGLGVSEMDVMDASPGDLAAACLDEGSAEGTSGEEADAIAAALADLETCMELAIGITNLCNLFD